MHRAILLENIQGNIKMSQINLKSPFKSNRLNILTSIEIEDLYSRPQLTEEERALFFELDQEEQKILVSNTSNATKVDAIIRLGYFKKKQQFFQFDLNEVEDDVKHILDRYFTPATLDKSTTGIKAKINNQKWVLRMVGYKSFNQSKYIPILLNKAKKLCHLSTDPIFIFRELLAIVAPLKIIRPGYSTFQKIISHALMSEQKRISKILQEHLSSQERSQLFKLLSQEENIYTITLLKQQPKNFKSTAIRQEIEYYEQYHKLHQIAKRLLPLLEVSKKGVEYYASLVLTFLVKFYW
ncbi:MAG: DUF4158 domain-containing protein [Oligoflexia bacterium]|nr:DUF4158 domain-containing protein [Oligoflexia bacterium]